MVANYCVAFLLWFPGWGSLLFFSLASWLGIFYGDQYISMVASAVYVKSQDTVAPTYIVVFLLWPSGWGFSIAILPL